MDCHLKSVVIEFDSVMITLAIFDRLLIVSVIVSIGIFKQAIIKQKIDLSIVK